jgi:hypothetical protein
LPGQTVLKHRQDEDFFQDLASARKDILLDKYILIIDYFQYKATKMKLRLLLVDLPIVSSKNPLTSAVTMPATS